MGNEVREIPFNGKTLLGVRTPDGNVWLAVKKACIDIGLSENQARAEIRKIQEAILFKNGYQKLSVKFDTQVRESLFLLEKFVPMWLAQINITPSMMENNPKASETLLVYQLEASEVLHKTFYDTEAQKSEFNKRMGLDGMQIQINNMENMIWEQTEKLNSVMENMTLSTRQQQKLYNAAKERINNLLGGAHSKEYKRSSKSYFINLWNGLKERYGCASYKDLNPVHFNNAFDFISKWEYTE